MDEGKCCSGFGEQLSLPVHYRGVQHDRKLTGSLKLHWRRGSRRGPKYPRRTLVGETSEP